MRILDKTVEVKKTQGDEYVFSIGPNSYSVSQGILQGLVDGGVDEYQTFIQNLAIRLSLSGIDPTDEAAVMDEIKRSKFKLPG